MIDFIESLKNGLNLRLSVWWEGVKHMIAFFAKKWWLKHIKKFICFIMGLPESQNSKVYYNFTIQAQDSGHYSDLLSQTSFERIFAN